MRTIPTRVGKTDRWRSGPSKRTDHPHARGENVAHALLDQRQNGPSPRAWGKLILEDDAVIQLRTIPTRVGKTRCSAGGSRARTDHPHARGEN